jgi:hypothetical protein
VHGLKIYIHILYLGEHEGEGLAGREAWPDAEANNGQAIARAQDTGWSCLSIGRTIRMTLRCAIRYKFYTSGRNVGMHG